MEDVIDNEAIAIANFTASRQKVERLLAMDKVTQVDIDGLTQMERECIAENCTAALQRLKGVERDKFLDKIDLVTHAITKRDIWEQNHAVISHAVASYMRQYAIMPTKSAIAQETGLSRQTVAKHFNEYERHPDFTAEMEQFKFMTPKMLANVFKYASNGDMKAARLYFEMVGAINKKQANTVVNEQNNYIQINNTILSQENLKRLTAEQLDQIERIIRK